MRVGFYVHHPFHRPILGPVFRLAQGRWRCLFTADQEHLVDFRPDVVVLSEAIADKLRARLPRARFVHTRHGLASKRVSYKGANESDYLCVTSEWMREWYLAAGARPRRDFWTIGYLQMDPLFRGGAPRLPQRVEPGRKVVLYAPTYNVPLSSAPMLGGRIGELIRGERDDVTIFIKPHPHIARHTPAWLEPWRKLAASDAHLHLVEDVDADVMPYLAAADLLITDASSVQLEYLALDRPMVLINNPARFGYQHFDADGPEWAWRDMGAQVDDVESLASAVSRGLNHPREHQSRRGVYRDRLFGDLTDGRAAERLIVRLEALAEEMPVASAFVPAMYPLRRARSLAVHQVGRVIRRLSRCRSRFNPRPLGVENPLPDPFASAP